MNAARLVDMADTKRYRHRVTGLVGDFPEALAETFPDDLAEVSDDALDLAYIPISPEAVRAVTSARVSEPHDDQASAAAPDDGSDPSNSEGKSNA